jgi:hypothetical protein
VELRDVQLRNGVMVSGQRIEEMGVSTAAA